MESLCGNHYRRNERRISSPATAPEALQPLLRSGVPCGDSPPACVRASGTMPAALWFIFATSSATTVPVMGADHDPCATASADASAPPSSFTPAESLDALPHGDNSEGDAG